MNYHYLLSCYDLSKLSIRGKYINIPDHRRILRRYSHVPLSIAIKKDSIITNLKCPNLAETFLIVAACMGLEMG